MYGHLHILCAGDVDVYSEALVIAARRLRPAEMHCININIARGADIRCLWFRSYDGRRVI